MLKRSGSLEDKYPEIAKEWHPTKNGDLTPDQVTPGSSRKVWWMCIQEHEWEAVIASRTRGTGCPYCSGKKASVNPNMLIMNPRVNGFNSLVLTKKETFAREGLRKCSCRAHIVV